MKIVKRIRDLKTDIRNAKEHHNSIGLVPTMGALHEGHLSLVHTAAEKDDFIVVTIFVNPTQFNNPGDLEKYPRNLEEDLKMLAEYPVDLIFVPDEKEMYPEKDNRVFDLSPLDRVMEGKFRPGHFNGVAQIVTKLFDASTPDYAYFGQKDFQQLAIIKKITRDLKLPIEIVGCPIIREKDGLAMSSRNQLLNKEQREAAPLIYRTLTEVKKQRGNLSVEEARYYVEKKINEHPLMQLEYFEIVHSLDLTIVSSWKNTIKLIGCVAVHMNEIRLIDNIYFD